MDIHWHRRDLRVADNRALAAAAERGRVLPVFVFDDDVLAHGSPPRVQFMLEALGALREDYRARGGDLHVLHGDPREVLPSLAREVEADRVTFAADYSGLAQERDAAVATALEDAGVDAEAVQDALLFEPGSITTNDGDHYSVFTYFWKKWRDRPKPDPVAAPPDDRLTASGAAGDLPTAADLGFDGPTATLPAAGTAAARDRLESFCSGPIERYETDREYPAREGSSRLSQDLHWGTIGVREVHAATADALADASGESADSVREFQSQLAWREFYAHVLYFNPAVVSENFREYERDIEWEDDEDLLAAWQAGETGYPIVDAGMRQLDREAYMHNRVRMIVASFLTKDLLVDWRHGYEWFRDHLVDHDTANDTGGWQWAASTGTDAQPYFRIFNPMTQGERYDPEAEYVHEYVPELRGVDPDVVHSWHETSPERRREVAPDYPDPVVDHAERRERALAMFERARGEPEE
jgi:deoxyribodipyrimidine photo-lyase